MCFNRNVAFLASECPRLLACARRHEFPSFATSIHSEALASPRVYALPHISTGLLTRCPSLTPLGLSLGPTNPTRTDLPSETLDLRRTWFSHVLRYSCRHSHSCTLQSTFQLAFSACRTLPYHSLSTIPSFGDWFKPRYIVRAIAFD